MTGGRRDNHRAAGLRYATLWLLPLLTMPPRAAAGETPPGTASGPDGGGLGEIHVYLTTRDLAALRPLPPWRDAAFELAAAAPPAIVPVWQGEASVLPRASAEGPDPPGRTAREAAALEESRALSSSAGPPAMPVPHPRPLELMPGIPPAREPGVPVSASSLPETASGGVPTPTQRSGGSVSASVSGPSTRTSAEAAMTYRTGESLNVWALMRALGSCTELVGEMRFEHADRLLGSSPAPLSGALLGLQGSLDSPSARGKARAFAGLHAAEGLAPVPFVAGSARVNWWRGPAEVRQQGLALVSWPGEPGPAAWSLAASSTVRLSLGDLALLEVSGSGALWGPLPQGELLAGITLEAGKPPAPSTLRAGMSVAAGPSGVHVHPSLGLEARLAPGWTGALRAGPFLCPSEETDRLVAELGWAPATEGWGIPPESGYGAVLEAAYEPSPAFSARVGVTYTEGDLVVASGGALARPHRRQLELHGSTRLALRDRAVLSLDLIPALLLPAGAPPELGQDVLRASVELRFRNAGVNAIIGLVWSSRDIRVSTLGSVGSLPRNPGGRLSALLTWSAPGGIVVQGELGVSSDQELAVFQPWLGAGIRIRGE